MVCLKEMEVISRGLTNMCVSFKPHSHYYGGAVTTDHGVRGQVSIDKDLATWTDNAFTYDVNVWDD